MDETPPHTTAAPHRAAPASAHRPGLDRTSAVAVAVMVAIGLATGAAVSAENHRSGAWALPPLPAGAVAPVVAATGADHAAAGQPDAAPTGAAAPPPTIDTTHLELTDNTLAGPGRVGVHAAADWVATTSAATGIPDVALRAYADATLALALEQPACHVGWTTLAAIGGIESGHGTHGGALLRPDGTSSVRILGPALDGRPGFAAIPATPESTGWHGDPVWDHAVGPLQFLPSTWERWAADGDDDGVADPNDIDDAALAAARYLCASGHDLTGADAWHAAVYSYNHSDQYVSDVLGAANRYATRSQTRRAAGAG